LPSPSRVSPIPLFEDQARAIGQPEVLEDPGSLDCLICAADDLERARTRIVLMDQEGTEDPLCFAKAWIRFGPLEPFKYRAELNAFMGKEWIAPNWKLELWAKKIISRKAWKA
jgi:hypothetical protein